MSPGRVQWRCMLTIILGLIFIIVRMAECSSPPSPPSPSPSPSPSSSSAAAAQDADCALWNVALCKPAYQRSVLEGGTADKGVDGNRNLAFVMEGCVRMSGHKKNWWLVDLMDEYLVHKIVVTNRFSNWEKLIPVTVDLFRSDPRTHPSFPTNTDGVFCTSIDTDFQKTKTFDCKTPTFARYVRLLKRDLKDFNFCEVQVLVSRKKGDSDCRRLVSKQFNVFRNSIVDKINILEKAVTNSAQKCVQLCTRRGYMCHAAFWTEAKGKCNMVITNPKGDGDHLIGQSGTDAYVEAPIKCLGDGMWKFGDGVWRFG